MFDLSKVPNDRLVEELIFIFEKQYPQLYDVLVEQRNEYMVKRIVALVEKYPESKILAVVGAGHKKGIINLLQKQSLQYQKN